MASRRAPHIAGLCLLLSCSSVQAEDFLEFSIRAAPARAAAIDAVLAKYAEPVEAAVPKQLDTTDFLRSLCANPKEDVKATRHATDGAAPDVVEFIPCAKARSDAQTRVVAGDTLEKIARRWGLHASEVSTLELAKTGGRVTAIAPESIQPGDVVTAPKVPLWTSFRVKTEKIKEPAALMKQFADALNCGREDPNACLIRLGVFVLTLDVPTGDPIEATERELSDLIAYSQVLFSLSATETGTSTSFEPAGPHVADEQWPYDAELVRLALADASNAGAGITPTVVGIAESGLAGRDGQPLPEGVFTRLHRDVPPPNGTDDDSNAYVDDFFGAGPQRGLEIMASGDLGFCLPGDPAVSPYSTLGAELKSHADHGPMVASLATGLRFRADASLDRVLPQLVFYRLSNGDCTPNAAFRVQPDVLTESVTYLAKRADVVNVSYAFDGSNGVTLAHAIMPSLSDSKLLVVPAGNSNQDLDELTRCPPCLALPDLAGSNAAIARRVLVVGAATRSLRRAGYSGWGDRTVKLFAPGEPAGAVDSLGADASTFSPATSFAAPYAAFAAATMRSLGISDWTSIVHRLQLATWPLFDLSGNRQRAGVLDLAKAVAVRHWAVEVRERTASGGTTLRTYLGRIADGDASFQMCDGRTFNRFTFQAVRFDDADEAGLRTSTAYSRSIDDLSRLKKEEMQRCTSAGTIRIETLREGLREFELRDVRLVLAPW